MQRNINIVYKIAIMALIALSGSILSSFTLFSNHVSAYSASITTSDSISLDVSPVGDGTAIHSESINVVSDCRSGYNLSISTPNGSDLYKYTNGVADSTASFTAVDGTSALSSSNNTNKWGFVLSSNPTSSTVFSPLSATPSIIRTSAQTASLDSDINDTFSIHYGIKVDNTIESGTYQMADNGSNTPGSIVYYLTMDATCSQYTVEFNPNGGTIASGSSNPTQAIQAGEPTKLLSSDSVKAPTTASYTDAGNNTINGEADKLWTFWGWNTNIDGTGDWYKDREEVEDLVSAGSTITLYAQWKQATLADMTTGTPVGTEKVIDHNEMQDMRPAICYNSPITTAESAPAATLLDTRGKVITDDPNTTESPEQYTVSKLPDNNCWMTKNLNLGRTTGGANNDGTITLTSDDTDLADNTTFTLSAGDTTSYTDTGNLAKVRLTNNSDTNANGAYYTWSAAVANTESTNTSPTTSICPKHWDLPINTNYTNLSSKSSYSSSNQTTAQPSNFLINGGFTDGSSFNQTSYSHFWTSTSSSTTAAYGARVDSSTMEVSSSTGSTYGGNKYYRKNLRCVASNGTATVHYNANGGTGTMPDQTGDINAITINSNSFTAPANSRFRNWNTSADGTGTTVTAGTPLSIIASDGDTITLYAQWDEVYYISFNANESSVGATSGSATGTMSNQTVIRNTATAIKTSTFALDSYIFLGWNTSADGTGTLYSDGQKVTNLTSTGNTITLYAIWSDGAYLDTGRTINQKLKRLAGNSTADLSTQDNAITALVRSDTLPNSFTASTENTISHSTSPFPIYAWYDSENTTIYYYSEATDILMNKDSGGIFYYMSVLSNLSTISTWDTVKVTNMSSMFTYAGYSNTTWFIGDLSSWNTSSVTNMSGMFFYAGRSATTWSIGDLSSWDTSSVTNMSSMFYEAGYSATTWSIGDLSSWDTSSVTKMSSMFRSAGRSATTWSIGDLSSWDTSNVTDMSSMFVAAGSSATTWSIGDLSSWNTSSVTTMSSMFSSAGYSATTWSIGDLSSWDTSSVTDMSSMFSNAGYSATTWSLDLSSWTVPSVTDMHQMFYYAGYSATTWSLDLSSSTISSVTDMHEMFCRAGYSATTWSLDLSSWDTSKVINMSSMFLFAGYSADSFSLNLSSWNTSSVADMSRMFRYAGYNATTWSIGDLSSWDTSNVTNMSQMFSYIGYNASIFTFDLSSWNVSSVTDMSEMFSNAVYSASTFVVNLASWDTSNATSMYSMFDNVCRNATTCSVTIPKTNDGTNTGPIANATYLFYGKDKYVNANPPYNHSFTLAE